MTQSKYKVDQILAKCLLKCTDNYARFRLCEETTSSLKDFWPILFDYRGSDRIQPVNHFMCFRNASQVLYYILHDAYNIYGVKSISFIEKSFLVENCNLYEITRYRKPGSCLMSGITQKGNPKYKVSQLDGVITLSFREDYITLLLE